MAADDAFLLRIGEKQRDVRGVPQELPALSMFLNRPVFGREGIGVAVDDVVADDMRTSIVLEKRGKTIAKLLGSKVNDVLLQLVTFEFFPVNSGCNFRYEFQSLTARSSFTHGNFSFFFG